MMDFWEKLTLAGKIIATILLLAFIALLVFLLVYFLRKNHKNNNSNTPEVAQVYEPSIGAPLPPDVKTDVKTDQVTTTATVNPPAQNPEVAGATTTELVAPKTGINPNEPIAYANDELKFSANLPVGTNVNETKQTVTFTSKNGTLEFMISVTPALNETIQTIASQLKNSSDVSHIVLNSTPNSLSFSNSHLGQGMAIIKNGNIYYLLGNSEYFSSLTF